MAKVNLRVRYEGGQGVVKGLDSEDSVEKLISHSLEALGVIDQQEAAIKLLSGMFIFISILPQNVLSFFN